MGIDPLIMVLDRCWRYRVTTSSDFASKYAVHIAMAASMHFITTHIRDQFYGADWNVTEKGLKWLRET